MKELISKCIEQNERAQMQLYDLNARRLFAICKRIVGDSMVAQEVMHDSFMKILNQLTGLQDYSRFDYWSKQIAIRSSIDWYRQNKRHKELIDNIEDDDELLCIDQDSEPNYQWAVDQVEMVKDKLLDLPQRYRVVLSLHLFEGMDLEEVSQILDIPYGTVRCQYVRGKKKLKDLLIQK